MATRQSLAHMTDAEKQEHKRRQASERKRNQRKKEKTMNEVVHTPEAIEAFIDELMVMSLDGAARALAMWRSEFKESFPAVPRPLWKLGMTHGDYMRLHRRSVRVTLARMFAVGYFPRESGRARLARFREREATAAEAAGVSLETFQKRKRIAKADADRRASALARRAA